MSELKNILNDYGYEQWHLQKPLDDEEKKVDKAKLKRWQISEKQKSELKLQADIAALHKMQQSKPALPYHRRVNA